MPKTFSDFLVDSWLYAARWLCTVAFWFFLWWTLHNFRNIKLPFWHLKKVFHGYKTYNRMTYNWPCLNLKMSCQLTEVWKGILRFITPSGRWVRLEARMSSHCIWVPHDVFMTDKWQQPKQQFDNMDSHTHNIFEWRSVDSLKSCDQRPNYAVSIHNCRAEIAQWASQSRLAYSFQPKCQID